MKHGVWLGLGAVVVFALVLAGCGGGGGGAINLGDNVIIDPPVGTTAVSPLASKFGPIANYLPPSGTIINYKLSGIMNFDGNNAKILFKSYNNTTGLMVLEWQELEGTTLQKHIRMSFWVKIINGQSYCYKRTKRFLDQIRPDETTTFTPGVLMGLFSATPGQLNCNFTQAGHSTGSRSFTQKYLGTQNVTVGGVTYACRISETSKFMTGDPARMQILWAPNKGPIVWNVGSVMMLKGINSGRLPLWARLTGGTVQSITTD